MDLISLVFAAGAVLATALASTALARVRRLERAAPPPESTLAGRVAEMELAFPRYRTEMADLASRAEDLLERAESKRRSAAARAQRAGEIAEGSQGEPPLPTDRGARKVEWRKRAGMI